MTRKIRRGRLAARLGVVAAMSLVAASCAAVDDPTLPLPEPQETQTALQETTAPEPTSVAASNACPAEGCKVSFQGIEDAGDELTLTFSSNFTPELSGNRFHVYWDRFEARQVSSDAASKHGVAQGEWQPTADNPFTTTGPAAVGRRGESTAICVTAGDKDNNVIDPAAAECRDVAGFL